MKQILILVVFLTITAAFIFSCGKSSNSTSSPISTPTTGTDSTISISNFSFNAPSLTIKAGTTVTWTNNDDATHTVTADDNSFTSGDLVKGAKFGHYFFAAGTFNYHCKYHPMMVAKVIAN